MVQEHRTNQWLVTDRCVPSTLPLVHQSNGELVFSSLGLLHLIGFVSIFAISALDGHTVALIKADQTSAIHIATNCPFAVFFGQHIRYGVGLQGSLSAWATCPTWRRVVCPLVPWWGARSHL